MWLISNLLGLQVPFFFKLKVGNTGDKLIFKISEVTENSVI